MATWRQPASPTARQLDRAQAPAAQAIAGCAHNPGRMPTPKPAPTPKTSPERWHIDAGDAATATLVHDLRTPLTALHGQLEALSSGNVDAPRVLQAALAQSNRVRRLSQQIFDLASLQSHGWPATTTAWRCGPSNRALKSAATARP